MTNKEYLQSLTPEELIETAYFGCPYSVIMIAAEEKKGNSICSNNSNLKNLKGSREIAEYVFSGKQKATCKACKIKWLSEERK